MSNKYINELNLVKQHGGYLNLGRCGWSLHINEHLAWPNDLSSKSTKTTTLSGYYNIEDTHPIYELCLDLNIPIIDSRGSTLEQACKTITLPLIDTSLNNKDNTYVSLKDYKTIVETKQYNWIKFYNI